MIRLHISIVYYCGTENLRSILSGIGCEKKIDRVGACRNTQNHVAERKSETGVNEPALGFVMEVLVRPPGELVINSLIVFPEQPT